MRYEMEDLPMNIIKQIQTTITNQFRENGMRRSDQLAVRRAYAALGHRPPGWTAK
jgi:hypothetical protein